MLENVPCYNTPGGITSVKRGADFNWSCVYLPAGPSGFGVEEGGADFHIFKNIPKVQQDAAWQLIEFLTNPDNAAEWAVATGYIAVNKKAYDTEVMLNATLETPEYLVSRDQLDFGHPQMMSLNSNEVRKILNNNLAAVVEGDKTIEEAQSDGQEDMTAAIATAEVKEATPEYPTSVPGNTFTPVPSSSAISASLSFCLAILLSGILAFGSHL